MSRRERVFDGIMLMNPWSLEGTRLQSFERIVTNVGLICGLFILSGSIGEVAGCVYVPGAIYLTSMFLVQRAMWVD